MFAINHAATALLVRRRFPRAPLVPLLVAVQLMEIAWVVLNVLGIERVETETAVHSVADIHLARMPYSHSVATMAGVAFLAWALLRFGFRRPTLAVAFAAGVLSHLVLDLVTHAPDIQLAPGLEWPKLGLGLYAALPLGALALELGYGFLCWRAARGGRALLVTIVLFNLANLSILSPSVPGPEGLLAGHPQWIVGFIALQIAVTLWLVGRLAPPASPDGARPRRAAASDDGLVARAG